MPRLTVFIPTLNRGATIGTCLTALVAQTCSDFEVLIVDGGSTDNTGAEVERFHGRLDIRWIEEGGGLVGAANAGWRHARGEIFTRTDDDAVPGRDWIAAILRAFDSGAQIGGVTGPTIIPAHLLGGRDLTFLNERMRHSKSLLWRLFARLYYGYFLEGQPFAVSRFFRSGAFSLGSNFPECLQIRGRIAADHLEACNWSVRRRLLDAIGGFDPAFGGLSEYHEPDAAYKIKSLGFDLVFDPDVRVEHRPSIVGVYKARPDAFGRASNFVLFYLRHIRLNTMDKLLRFALYLALINTYWLYKALVARDVRALGGPIGSLVALYRYRRAGAWA